MILRREWSSEMRMPVEILQISILYIVVCSCLDKNKTLEIVQTLSPAGTKNNWQEIEGGKCHDGTPDEVQCASNPDRKHFVFVC